MVGYRATPLQSGLTRYEYGVYNMNSDKSVRTFSVPIPAGLSVTNVGFNDVTYRGNDGMGGNQNFSGADWTFVNTGTALEWSTQTFAQSSNANAIRWGTMYSFRFDANAVPTPGTINMETFKVVGTVSTVGDVPGGPGAPGVDFCAGDGSLVTWCPCANFAQTPGNGCENSQNPDGAHISSSGTVAPDTVVLSASGELSTSLTIFVQGTAMDANGIAYGDGVRCAAGTLKRLYTKSASAGAVSAPTGGDPSITTRSAAIGFPNPPGTTRYYFAFYRDGNPAFCPEAMGGSSFNATNGQIITW
jgi:hypothetical protein